MTASDKAQWKGGGALRRLRESLGLSQEEMARLLGYSRGALSLWESGERTPSADLLDRLVALFGIDINDLLAGKDVRPTRYPPGAVGLKMKLRAEGFDEDAIQHMLWLYEKFAPRNRNRESSSSDPGTRQARAPAFLY